jgi:hypothetical protein
MTHLLFLESQAPIVQSDEGMKTISLMLRELIASGDLP